MLRTKPDNQYQAKFRIPFESNVAVVKMNALGLQSHSSQREHIRVPAVCPREPSTIASSPRKWKLVARVRLMELYAPLNIQVTRREVPR